jgi:NitT/TauT family transport system ATP-binding protein
MMPPAITVQNLCFAYKLNGSGSQTVFDQVSFTVGRGQIVCLVGPSGCGKSTLLNLVTGFLQPDSGHIQINHDEAGGSGRVGYIFQRDALLPWRTVRGNLLLGGELGDGTCVQNEQQRIHDYLRIFNLDESVLGKYPVALSGGMRQRVSIVQSLMTEPNILLLDEPFSALDFYTKLKLEAEFRDMISGSGKAALLVTHDIDEAIAVSDKIPHHGRKSQRHHQGSENRVRRGRPARA